MFQIGIDPILFSVGPLQMSWHGVASAVGVLVAIFLLGRELQRRGLEQVDLTELILWALPAGVVGARLAHVIDLWSFYSAHPINILAINEGGLSIYGGIIGALIGGIAYFKVRRLPLWAILDAVVPAALVGQSIGRIGCLINGDAWGAPTNLPWGVVYTNPADSLPHSLLGVATHPYPAYEIIWNMAILGVLWRVSKSRLPEGTIFCLYAVGYSLGRIILSGVRQETIVVWQLQQAQIIGIAGLVVALLVLASRLYPALRMHAPTGGWTH